MKTRKRKSKAAVIDINVLETEMQADGWTVINTQNQLKCTKNSIDVYISLNYGGESYFMTGSLKYYKRSKTILKKANDYVELTSREKSRYNNSEKLKLALENIIYRSLSLNVKRRCHISSTGAGVALSVYNIIPLEKLFKTASIGETIQINLNSNMELSYVIKIRSVVHNDKISELINKLEDELLSEQL